MDIIAFVAGYYAIGFTVVVVVGVFEGEDSSSSDGLDYLIGMTFWPIPAMYLLCEGIGRLPRALANAINKRRRREG